MFQSSPGNRGDCVGDVLFLFIDHMWVFHIHDGTSNRPTGKSWECSNQVTGEAIHLWRSCRRKTAKLPSCCIGMAPCAILLEPPVHIFELLEIDKLFDDVLVDFTIEHTLKKDWSNDPSRETGRQTPIFWGCSDVSMNSYRFSALQDWLFCMFT